MGRTKAPEEVLMWIMNDIRRSLREDTAKTDRKKLFNEDQREEEELFNYVLQAIAAAIPNRRPKPGEENKHQTERDAAIAWREAQTGNVPPRSDRNPREGR